MSRGDTNQMGVVKDGIGGEELKEAVLGSILNEPGDKAETG